MSQLQINTELLINATGKEIWTTLMDFEAYPNWNPFIKMIAYQVENQNTLIVKLQEMTFKPSILINEAPFRFEWLSHFLFNGLFDGKHCFELVEINKNQTLFKHSEFFSGLLVPIFKKQLLTETKEGFEHMNEALRIEVLKRRTYSSKPNE